MYKVEVIFKIFEIVLKNGNLAEMAYIQILMYINKHKQKLINIKSIILVE